MIYWYNLGNYSIIGKHRDMQFFVIARSVYSTKADKPDYTLFNYMPGYKREFHLHTPERCKIKAEKIIIKMRKRFRKMKYVEWSNTNKKFDADGEYGKVNGVRIFHVWYNLSRTYTLTVNLPGIKKTFERMHKEEAKELAEEIWKFFRKKMFQIEVVDEDKPEKSPLKRRKKTTKKFKKIEF